MQTTDKIEAVVSNLDDILVKKKNLYQIPNYQRPYSWDVNQISELVDDLTIAYTDDQDKSYFCGSLVLVRNSNSTRYDVIDGQQRITTFIIMACVLRDVYGNQLGDQAKDFVDDSIRTKYDNEDKLKFLTDANHQTKFQQTVLDGIDFSTSPGDNQYLKNAKCMKNVFSDKFEKNEICVTKFVEWVFEKVVLTMIVCPSEDSAIRIFDVLNSRGIPLSHVDILKAWLMTSLSEDDRNSFAATWYQITQHLEYCDLSMEGMLFVYLNYKDAPNTKLRLDKALKKIFEIEEMASLKIVHELHEFSKSYSATLLEEEKHVYCLRYLTHEIYWNSILVTARFTKYPQIKELRSVLVAFYYQHFIAGSYVTRIKQVSLNIIKAVKAKQSIDEIKETFLKNLINYGVTPQFHEELRGNDVYNKKWIRPLLLLLNYFATDDSAIKYVEPKREIHVEHVLPQTPDDAWRKKFPDDTDKTIEKWENSLANLTLLSGNKNSQASNHSFAKKQDVYLGETASSFIITQKIANDFNNWNVKSLKKRKECLLNSITKKLDIFSD